MVSRRLQSGFTATEILVVVGIVGILAMIAIPSMGRMLATQAVRSAAYDLVADLTYARSEAIARGVNVQVISAGAAGNFKQGWQILAPAAVLRIQAARSSPIVFTGSANQVTFDKTGRVVSGAETAWGIKPSDSSANQAQMLRCIRLDPSGRPRTQEGNSCGL